jgi:hypothetical protein
LKPAHSREGTRRATSAHSTERVKRPKLGRLLVPFLLVLPP